jgi:dTDP-4-amino-4,6-dideoxygalactose transaminase
MSKGVYRITEEFEQALSDYTGAPYVVTIDNACNALFLCLYYEKNIAKTLQTDTIKIPSRTYPGVPPEIIRNGLKIDFYTPTKKTLKGAYQLEGSNVWDSALRFTHNMYIPGSFMCISMTGGLKNFKMGSKAGAILCDDPIAVAWFKRARFSGRREIPYMEDNLDMLGWNYYLNPELAVRGLILMTGFYKDGKPISIPDMELPYPDLSKFEIYTKANRECE